MAPTAARQFIPADAPPVVAKRLPVPRDPFVRSEDIRDIAAMSTRGDDSLVGESVQLESAPFSAHWTTVQLPALKLQFSRGDVALVHQFKAPEDRWVFFIPLSAPRAIRWDGCAVSGEAVIVIPPGAESFVFEPGGTELAIVSVEADAARELVQAARTKVENGAHGGVVQPPPELARALVSGLIELRTIAEVGAAAISREFFDRAERFIRERLHKCLNGSTSRQPAGDALRTRNHIVRRAEAFFRAHVGETVSMAQLSAIAGVSERSLRNAFHQIYTTSPKRYLKIWQLHQVHRSLRASVGSTATVTSVATEHGFFELGRFAREYRTLFGESPSQTLNNARLQRTPVQPRWAASAAR